MHLDKEFMRRLFVEAANRRQGFQQSHWLNVRSFWNRLFSSETEFSSLLAEEPAFVLDFRSWLISHLGENNVTSERHIDELLTIVKSFAQRTEARLNWSIAYAALLAPPIGYVLGQSMQFAGWLTAVLLMMIFLEQANLSQARGTAHDIVSALEYHLANNQQTFSNRQIDKECRHDV